MEFNQWKQDLSYTLDYYSITGYSFLVGTSNPLIISINKSEFRQLVYPYFECSVLSGLMNLIIVDFWLDEENSYL